VFPFGDFEMDKIDISPLDPEMNNVSFRLFREWRKGYMEDKNISEFNIVNEQELIKATKRCLVKAIHRFFTGDKYQELGLEGDWYYFTLNLLLSIQLEYDYSSMFIVRTSDDYKTFVALTQIQNYLDDEISRKLEINADYKKKMELNVNLEGFDLHLSGNSNEELGFPVKDIPKDDKDYVKHILSKLTLDHLLKIIRSQNMDYIKNFRDAIPPAYVDKLLETNEHLFAAQSTPYAL